MPAGKMMVGKYHAMEQNIYAINAHPERFDAEYIVNQCSLWWLTKDHHIDPYVQNILRRMCLNAKDLQQPATDQDYDDLLKLNLNLNHNPDDTSSLLPYLNSRTFKPGFIESLNNPWITLHMRVKSTHLA